MADYKLAKDSIIRVADGAFIPLDQANSDYARYLDWVSKGNTPDPIDVPALATTVKDFIHQIDGDVDAIYGAVTGNRQAEYSLAESEAKAFIAAAYAGTAPGPVQSWADAKAWTTQKAADDIAATAAQWRTVQGVIRARRLLDKEKARTAVDQAALDVIKTGWATFVSSTRAQIGL